jgi:hypothetical protein
VTTVQSSLIMHLDCEPAEVKELITNLCAIPSAAWDWSTCSHWLWFGVAGDDSPGEFDRACIDKQTAILRLRLVMVIAARVDCWRSLDASLGYSYDTIMANAKAGIDLLIRSATFDPDWMVRLAAISGLEQLNSIEGIAALSQHPGSYSGSSLEAVQRYSLYRNISAGAQN